MWGFFEKPSGQAQTAVSLFLSGKGIEASGYEESGGFVVRTDSRAVKDEVPKVPAAITALRKVLVTKGIFVEEEGSYRLTQDYLFNSPSQAADVMLGNSSNGRLAVEGRPRAFTEGDPELRGRGHVSDPVRSGTGQSKTGVAHQFRASRRSRCLAHLTFHLLASPPLRR